MKCQLCAAAEATVHITDVVDQVRRVRHLCAGCAEAESLFTPAPDGDPQATEGLNLEALVNLVFQADPTPAEAASVAADLSCPGCGLQYAAFRAGGRLGCAADYEAFRTHLLPILDRLHRATRHSGKRPARFDCYDLRHRLAAAVAAEDFETATVLRDELRRKERDR